MRAILPEDNLLFAEEALKKFISALPPKIYINEIQILDSLDKISAEDVYSPIDLPPFSRSTVDGYALRFEETPGKFELKGKISIGEYKEIKIEKNEAIEVDTGAVLPEGANAVVKIEETKIEEGKIIVNKKLKFGQNVAWVGSDIPKGFQILRKGEKITPEKIATLASVGIQKVKVYGPRVYVITTGDELEEPGEKLEKGKIYESNAYYLIPRLKEYIPVGYSIVKDNKDEIRKEIEKALQISDVLIITGGTSAGEKDYVHEIIREKGQIVVHGIKFKPGKPTILGIINGKAVFGLPGNIVSTIMVYEQIIRKYINSLSGKEKENKIKAKALIPIEADKKRFTYIPVYILKNDKNTYFLPIPFDSYMIGSFSSADGYIALNPGTKIEEDQEADVVVKNLDERPTLIGEEDLKEKEIQMRKILLGSYPACKALEKGVGDVIVVSSLICNPEKYDYEYERKILVNGEGPEIGYHDWIGISKLIKNPSVKLKSPSTAQYFIGKAKVYAPEGYIEGKEIYREKIYVVNRNQNLTKY
jgi:molybdenum cofactor synthesis domain-containing protein